MITNKSYADTHKQSNSNNKSSNLLRHITCNCLLLEVMNSAPPDMQYTVGHVSLNSSENRLTP